LKVQNKREEDAAAVLW